MLFTHLLNLGLNFLFDFVSYNRAIEQLCSFLNVFSNHSFRKRLAQISIVLVANSQYPDTSG